MNIYEFRFVHGSAKRQYMFKQHFRQKFSGLCETRWIEKHTGFIQFYDGLPNKTLALREIADWSVSNSASDFKAMIASVDVKFIVNVYILSKTLAITRPLSLHIGEFCLVSPLADR